MNFARSCSAHSAGLYITSKLSTTLFQPPATRAVSHHNPAIGGSRLAHGHTVKIILRALIVLYSEDLEGTLRQVEAAGGSVVTPIFSFPGGRRFHFVEPGGNELAVWSEPEA